jgi:hypothetical protein
MLSQQSHIGLSVIGFTPFLGLLAPLLHDFV